MMLCIEGPLRPMLTQMMLCLEGPLRPMLTYMMLYIEGPSRPILTYMMLYVEGPSRPMLTHIGLYVEGSLKQDKKGPWELARTQMMPFLLLALLLSLPLRALYPVLVP